MDKHAEVRLSRRDAGVGHLLRLRGPSQPVYLPAVLLELAELPKRQVLLPLLLLQADAHLLRVQTSLRDLPPETAAVRVLLQPVSEEVLGPVPDPLRRQATVLPAARGRSQGHPGG